MAQKWNPHTGSSKYNWNTNPQLTIGFYRQVGKYGWFSNFHSCPNLLIDGMHFPTTEHYFQAMKTTNPTQFQAIATASTPSESAKMGRSRKDCTLRPDWETKKMEVMRRALYCKFMCEEEFRNLLLSTHGYILVEHTKNDNFWGDGGNWTGENWLGRMLMEIRDASIAMIGKGQNPLVPMGIAYERARLAHQALQSQHAGTTVKPKSPPPTKCSAPIHVNPPLLASGKLPLIPTEAKENVPSPVQSPIRSTSPFGKSPPKSPPFSPAKVASPIQSPVRSPLKNLPSPVVKSPSTTSPTRAVQSPSNLPPSSPIRAVQSPSHLGSPSKLPPSSPFSPSKQVPKSPRSPTVLPGSPVRPPLSPTH